MSLLTLAAVLLLPRAGDTADGNPTPDVRLPPAHAPADYQLGGAYPPPDGTTLVVRDHQAAPAADAYNVCYVNAFQVQPGHTDDWPPDLLLRDADGRLVIDRRWQEVLLDLSTPDKRRRAAARVGAWIDDCADRGFDAVEPDNLDSYTRSQRLLTQEHALAYAALLAERAHRHGLAVAQKNAAELTPHHRRMGTDFAVAEECGQYDECDTYRTAYGDRVLVVEYTDTGLARACARWGHRLSVVRRDRTLTTPADPDYRYRTCATTTR